MVRFSQILLLCLPLLARAEAPAIAFRLHPLQYALAKDAPPQPTIALGNSVIGPDKRLYFATSLKTAEGQTAYRNSRGVASVAVFRSSQSGEALEWLADGLPECTGLTCDALGRLFAEAAGQRYFILPGGNYDRLVQLEASAVTPTADLPPDLAAKVAETFALGQASEEQPFLRSQLVERLNDPAAEVRHVAARLLGDFHHATAAPALLSLLQDSNQDVQVAAATALGNLPVAENSAEALWQQLPGKTGLPYHALLRAYTVHATAADMVEAGNAENATPEQRLLAVQALKRIGNGAVSQFLSDPDPKVALEAAVALTELRMLSAWPELVERLTPECTHKPFVELAIAAAQYLGTQSAAGKVLAYAMSTAPEELRLLAMTTLEKWDQPDLPNALPRVPGLTAGMLRQELPKFLRTATELSKTAATRLLAQAEKPMATALMATAKDATKPNEDRILALQALQDLGRNADASFLEYCRNLRSDNATPPPVRAMAREIYMEKKVEEIPNLAREAMVMGSAIEKQRALAVLGKSKGEAAQKLTLEYGVQLVRDLLDNDVRVELIEIAHQQDKKRGIWRKVIDQWQGHLNLHVNPLTVYISALQNGDAKAGEQVFHNNVAVQCTRCHTLDGGASRSGPSLQGVGGRLDFENLLLALLQPSQKVLPGYGLTTATLNDGTIVSGQLLAESKEHVTIASGPNKDLARKDIRQLDTPVSPMPPLAALLTLRELRDLVAYLQTLK
jgi:quinoprotein glucose dehydrogenase